MRLARSRALPLSHRARAQRAAAQLRLYLRLGLSDREPLPRAAKGHRAAATGSTNKGHRAAGARAQLELHPLPAQARVPVLRGQLHLRSIADGTTVIVSSLNVCVCQHDHGLQELPQERQHQELQQVLLARAGALRARTRQGVRARVARLTRRRERRERRKQTKRRRMRQSQRRQRRR